MQVRVYLNFYFYFFEINGWMKLEFILNLYNSWMILGVHLIFLHLYCCLGEFILSF